jgi:2-dehydro-3-deoxygluconokinase
MTGITPALSKTSKTTTIEIIKKASELGIKISFDLNYRSLLWEFNEAKEAWGEILPYVNIIISTETDAALLCNQELSRKDYLKRIYNDFHPDAVVLTCGGDGSMAFNGQKLMSVGTWPVKAVNRLGAGDAFDAGFLYGYITESLHKGLAYGNAMAVLKMTLPQNIPLIRLEEVDRLIAGDTKSLLR